MKRRYKLILSSIGAIVLLVLMFMWLTGNLSRERKISPGKLEVKQKTAEGLNTLELTAVTIPARTEAVGTVTARESVQISSRIMAEITRAVADAGEAVKKGQTLLVLDSRDAETGLLYCFGLRGSCFENI